MHVRDKAPQVARDAFLTQAAVNPPVVHLRNSVFLLEVISRLKAINKPSSEGIRIRDTEP